MNAREARELASSDDFSQWSRGVEDAMIKIRVAAAYGGTYCRVPMLEQSDIGFLECEGFSISRNGNAIGIDWSTPTGTTGE